MLCANANSAPARLTVWHGDDSTKPQFPKEQKGFLFVR